MDNYGKPNKNIGFNITHDTPFADVSNLSGNIGVSGITTHETGSNHLGNLRSTCNGNCCAILIDSFKRDRYKNLFSGNENLFQLYAWDITTGSVDFDSTKEICYSSGVKAHLVDFNGGETFAIRGKFKPHPTLGSYSGGMSIRLATNDEYITTRMEFGDVHTYSYSRYELTGSGWFIGSGTNTYQDINYSITNGVETDSYSSRMGVGGTLIKDFTFNIFASGKYKDIDTDSSCLCIGGLSSVNRQLLYSNLSIKQPTSIEIEYTGGEDSPCFLEGFQISRNFTSDTDSQEKIYIVGNPFEIGGCQTSLVTLSNYNGIFDLQVDISGLDNEPDSYSYTYEQLSSFNGSYTMSPATQYAFQGSPPFNSLMDDDEVFDVGNPSSDLFVSSEITGDSMDAIWDGVYDAGPGNNVFDYTGSGPTGYHLAYDRRYRLTIYTAFYREYNNTDASIVWFYLGVNKAIHTTIDNYWGNSSYYEGVGPCGSGINKINTSTLPTEDNYWSDRNLGVYSGHSSGPYIRTSLLLGSGSLNSFLNGDPMTFDFTWPFRPSVKTSPTAYLGPGPCEVWTNDNFADFFGGVLIRPAASGTITITKT